MLATVRHDRILTALRATGAVRIADLAADLDVSEMTVRRDLAELAERGLVRKVHGGAVAPDAPRPGDEPAFAAKSDLMAAEKAGIARAAACLVEPGASVAISAGTTTHALAHELVRRTDLRPLTVVTNSLPVADTLYRADGVTTVLTGGERTPSDALVGPLAEAALADLRVDVAFLGAHGVSVDHGLTTPNLAEASTDRALRAAAAATVVLADHSKWQVTGLARWARLDDVDVLVTDDGLEPADRDAAAEHAGRVVVAEVAR
ncbi:DeoR/GlpR family DNA-binding transcription regulator [Luteimicrobium subarcticum]|uniref:DeoR family transcriptional regulator n=1 Tax=Luteimicrobium subarcticum TaxID=620910 RepID=A0A2M8WV32_9MICO|nr:DeoR/GlpR family DNA-binding transcription regulator [Luteimicrobium subarcticum]PJI94769.1 DeoR family transcriptional regulator [Luteimicrobium subarcticum]